VHVRIRGAALAADRLAIQQQPGVLRNQPHVPHQLSGLQRDGVEAAGAHAAQTRGQLTAGRGQKG
jgi:hypothetical protein